MKKRVYAVMGGRGGAGILRAQRIKGLLVPAVMAMRTCTEYR